MKGMEQVSRVQTMHFHIPTGMRINLIGSGILLMVDGLYIKVMRRYKHALCRTLAIYLYIHMHNVYTHAQFYILHKSECTSTSLYTIS